jgi:hypothetical protein
MSSNDRNRLQTLEALTFGPANVTGASALRWRQNYTNELVNHRKVKFLVLPNQYLLLSLCYRLYLSLNNSQLENLETELRFKGPLK